MQERHSAEISGVLHVRYRKNRLQENFRRRFSLLFDLWLIDDLIDIVYRQEGMGIDLFQIIHEL